MSASPARADRRGRAAGGLALITVLWLVSLLTLLATAAVIMTRHQVLMASRAEQMLAAEVAADSAIRLTLLSLNAPSGDGPEVEFAMLWRIQLFERDLSVRIEREAGRVDLNTADDVLLAAVLTAGGIESGRARSFAARVVDWRDADDEPGAGGAEQAQYHGAGAGYGPRNRPFESVSEVRRVLGLGDLDARVLDAFTVYSTMSPTIVPEFSHPLVRSAAQLLPATATTSSAAPPLADRGRHTLAGQALRIGACTMADVMTLCRTAVVRLADDQHENLRIYAWYTDEQ